MLPSLSFVFCLCLVIQTRTPHSFARAMCQQLRLVTNTKAISVHHSFSCRHFEVCMGSQASTCENSPCAKLFKSLKRGKEESLVSKLSLICGRLTKQDSWTREVPLK